MRLTLHVIAIILAANIIFLTAFYLSNINVRSFPTNQTFQLECLLDGYSGQNSYTICTLTYLLSAASILFSIFIIVLILLTFFRLYISDAVDVIVSGILTVIWLAAAVVVTIFAVEANQRNFIRRRTRNLVVLLFYGVFVSYLANMITAIITWVGRRRGKGRGEVVEEVTYA